jgi:flagellar biosynthesis protein FlhB
MAESQQSDLEKTEPASPRRLEQAREQGQVARSIELNNFSSLVVSGGLLLFAGATLIDGMRTLFATALHLDRAHAFDPAVAMSRLYESMVAALWVLAPLFVACLLVALLSPMLLSGWLFSTEALQPKLLKLLESHFESRKMEQLTHVMRDIVNYHTTPEQAAAQASAAGAKQLVFNHVVPPMPVSFAYPAFMGDAKNFYKGPMTVGEDGMLFSLPAGSTDSIRRKLF